MVNPGLLTSAVGAPQHTFDGQDLWPSLHEKAAVLFRSLACNHAFEDGNKRTAVLSLYLFYGFNGYIMTVDQLEVVHFVVDVVVRHYEIDKIAERLELWCEEIPEPT